MNRRTYRFSGEWMYPFGFGLGYGELVLKSAKLTSSAGRWTDNGEERRCYIPSELFDYRGGSAREGSASAVELGTNEELLFAVEVSNQGARETRETLQVYVAHPEQPTAPRYQLCGIQSVTLAPGAQRIVEIPVSVRWLMIVDESGVRYLPESTVDFYIGTAAPGGEKLGAAQPLHHRTEFCRRS